MKKIFFILLAATAMCPHTSLALEDFVYEIPFAETAQIDGDAAEWKSSALEIPLVSDVRGVRPASPHRISDAKFYFAWNQKGLLVFAEVKDKHIQDGGTFLWENDNVSIFVSNRQGGQDKIQFVFSPHLNGEQIELQHTILNQRSSRPLTEKPMSCQSAVKKNDDGYSVEILIPLEQVGVTPSEGLEIGCNVSATDYLPRAKDAKKSAAHTLSWNMCGDSHYYFRGMNRIRLSAKAGQRPVTEVKSFIINEPREWFFSVFSKEPLGGKTISATNASGKLCSLTMHKNTIGNHAAFSFQPSPEELAMPATINIDDIPVAEVNPKMIAWDYNFRAKVNRYLDDDDREPFPKGGIVFTGHSQIDMWETIEADMAPLKVLRRGISGAQAFHIVEFMDELVIKHAPSKVVYFIGGNDMRAGKSPQEILAQIKIFVNALQKKCPSVKIWLVGIQTTKDDMAAFRSEYNSLLKKYAAESHGKITFINPTALLMDDKGQIPAEYKKFDNVHFSEKGYALIAPEIKKALMEPAKQTEQNKKTKKESLLFGKHLNN